MDSPFGIIEIQKEEEKIEDENILENDVLDETEEPDNIIEQTPKKKFSQTEVFKSSQMPIKKVENDENSNNPLIQKINGSPEQLQIEYELDDLKTMKNNQLKQICKDKKIKNFSKLSKPDLINIILGKPISFKIKEIPVNIKKTNKITNIKTLKKESNNISKIQVNNIIKKELEKYDNEKLLIKQQKKEKLLLEKKMKEDEEEKKINQKIINKIPESYKPKQLWEFF
tara:strand:- start:1422 stop:2102 length:681 start_codon:yes stop_codon:yes gene_type:complete